MPKNYYRRLSNDLSIDTMKAALVSMEEYPNAVPKTEIKRFLSTGNVSGTRFYNARLVIKRRPDLIPEILAGTLSVFRAHELATKGERVRCSSCKGKGFIFQ